MTVDLTNLWVYQVGALGGQRVLVTPGQLSTDRRDRSIAPLARMADSGRSTAIIVSVETRGGGGGGRQGGAAPVQTETSRDRWMLLADVIRSADAYSNVDLGGARAANQQELHDCLTAMMPFTAGSLHTRVNTAWDLATAKRYLENDLGWRGLYTIESGGGHEGTKDIYDVVMATL
jgi:hypothetical protein